MTALLNLSVIDMMQSNSSGGGVVGRLRMKFRDMVWNSLNETRIGCSTL